MANDPLALTTMVYDGQANVVDEIDGDPSGLATMVYGRQTPAHQVPGDRASGSQLL